MSEFFEDRVPRAAAVVVRFVVFVFLATLTAQTGFAAVPVLSESSFNFGNVTLSSTLTHHFTLTNTGTVPVNLVTLSLQNGLFFTVNDTCNTTPRTLAAGASCGFDAAFKPLAVGAQTGTITYTYDAGAVVLPLSGTGIVGPAITLMSPSWGAPNSTVTGVITGLNLGGATAVAFSGTGVTAVIDPSATATSVPVTITIASGTALGLRTVTLTAASGVSTPFSGFTVAATGPTITSINPTSGFTGGSLLGVITGTSLTGTTAINFSGSGVTATVQSATATTVRITITILSTATLDTRTLSVTASGVTSRTFSGFTVNPAPPVIRGMVPSSGDPGMSFPATITGTALTGVTAVNFSGAGVSATIRSGGTSTSVPITVTIAADASTGPRDVTVTNPVATSEPFVGFRTPTTRLGTWTALTNQPPASLTNCLLLTDGRVMCQQVASRNWFALSPTSNGSYVSGTWSPLAPMQAGYAPLYFSSAVLKDGRVIVMGGEYECTNGCTTTEQKNGAIYDPIANAWTTMAAPTGWTTIGDAMAIVLSDGTYMQSDCCSGKIALLDAAALTWTPIAGAPLDNSNGEEGWVLLPDGSVLNVDMRGTQKNQTSRYIPATGTWISAGLTPAPLGDNGTPHTNLTTVSNELGPGLLRPDGTVFWIGGVPEPTLSAHTGIYNTATNTWSAGPDLPNHDGSNDGPSALLPNGNVLLQGAPAGPTNAFGSPSHFYEFDGEGFTLIPPPTNCAASGFCPVQSYIGAMLVLPTGEVLVTEESNHLEVYSSTGRASSAWLPTVSSVPGVIRPSQTYTITGTQFNGLSAGASYGDDLQSSTNYPLVRITNRSTGHVVYARTHDHSSMGVATGNTPVSTQFDVPADIESGPSDIEVVANGLASAKQAVSVVIPGTVISAVTSASTTTTVAISWTTDQVSDSQVDYGASSAYGQATLLDLSPVTSHFVLLSGLTANTAYHFRVKSRGTDGFLSASNDFTVTTLAQPNTSAPVISAVAAPSINPTSVTVSWTTDKPSDSQVEFGTTLAYGRSTTLDPTMVTSHTVTVSALATNTTYHFRVKSRDTQLNLAAGNDATVITQFSFSSLGGASRLSDGLGALAVGYGRIHKTSGAATPSGVAIFGLQQDGVLVNEAGVPDQPMLTSGRFYAEISADGLVNTGLAIANPNNATASVNFTVRDAGGVIVRTGVAIIGPNQQLARFLDQNPYLVSPGIQGSFTFSSNVPVGVIALRGYLNERTPREFLTTTLPVLDLTSPASSGTQVIPHFAAGDGWTTYVVLVNATDIDQAGSIQFLNAGNTTTAGAPQLVSIDGLLASNAAYTVKANSSKKFVITNIATGTLSGSVRIIPSGGGPAPTPLAIFSYKSKGITVSEAGVPVVMGNSFRLFAQLSTAPVIRTGVAISNATSTPGTVTLSLTDLSGTVTLGTSPGLALPASGQIVGFLDELIPSLSGQSVQGVLRISSSNISSISVVGLRLRINQRQDALITTTPPTNENGALSSADRLFPHVVNGQGWTTQFILISPTSSGPSGQPYEGTLSFGAVDGTRLDLNIN